MTTSLPVLINGEGGAASKAGDKLPEQVTKAFAAAGSRVDIEILASDEIEHAIERAASSHRRIIVAGGDGTIAAVAQLLTGTDTELAILPLGTLNHFARDLGIPTDLKEAAKVAVSGTAKPVDVGEVNGIKFINNVSVGLYPFMVRNRDDIREHRGWPKWLAMVPASWDALSRLPRHRLRIDMGAGDEPIVTPLLFVGNNHYSLEGGSVGNRDSLTDGELSVYAVSRASRIALLWFGMRAMVGKADRERDFAALGDTATLTVRSSNDTLEVALDGEIRRLKLPLKFAIHPGGIQLVRPSEVAG